MVGVGFCTDLVAEHAHGHEQPVQASHRVGGIIKEMLVSLVFGRLKRASRHLGAAANLKILPDPSSFRLVSGRKVKPGAPSGELPCGVSGNGGRGSNDEHICSADLRHSHKRR
jgi:hypothetical protein